MQPPVRPQALRFYDGGLPAGPHGPGVRPDPNAEPRIVLERVTAARQELFRLGRRVAYLDRELGELLVPGDLDRFRTDLASVPWLFTWLVPRTGAHLPAAILHDGLVDPDPSRGVAGPGVDRVTADRVFRDAMADTGTPLVRRWLIWTAVTTWTLLRGRGTPWTRARIRWYQVVVVGTLVVIGYLGYCATVDLFDRTAPLALPLPWMGTRSFAAELVGGLAGAAIIPFVLGWLWGRFRVAGWILGIALALLLHVTVVLLLLTAAYRVAEWLAGQLPTTPAGEQSGRP